MRPLAIDLFCCAGGATRGLQDAGFRVVGVDIEEHSNYCGDDFIRADALTLDPRKLAKFYSFIWASPPCQKYSMAQRIRKNEHPDLIGPTRRLLEASGVRFCIENVPGAPLLNPITLCGSMFGLQTYRHRVFECYPAIAQPMHERHEAKNTKMGRPPKDGEFIQVVGNFSGVQAARDAMGIPWMSRNQLREAIPPAYSRHIAQAPLFS